MSLLMRSSTSLSPFRKERSEDAKLTPLPEIKYAPGVNISFHPVKLPNCYPKSNRDFRNRRTYLGGRRLSETSSPDPSENRTHRTRRQSARNAQSISMSEWDNRKHDCQDAGIFIFAPFIQQLDIPQIVQKAGLPGSKMIPALSYFLAFLAVKIVGTERYAHMGKHAFDSGIGLFAGLNVLPKCTAMSTYSYGLDPPELLRLQITFVKQVNKLGLIDKKVINLDFHTIPHFGEESVLQEHWAGAGKKRMKGALTLFAQDASSKLILYTAADIHRNEADDQVLSFLKYWQGIQSRIKPTFVFDSRFTTYANLSALNQRGIKFITLRRRGKKLIQDVNKLKPWKRINIPHAKRKFPNPLVHESIRLTVS